MFALFVFDVVFVFVVCECVVVCVCLVVCYFGLFVFELSLLFAVLLFVGSY